jgi:putative transposase
MRDLLLLAIHLLVTLAKLLRPGGARAVVAESLLLKHQLVIINRSRQRAANLSSLDRFGLGLTTLFVSPHRIAKLSAILKPATLFKFHKALVDRKYRLLFSSSSIRRKPGPKGPSTELIAAIVEMKRRNPKFGYVRIAQQIAHAFGVAIDKDVVRRVLAKYYRPGDSGTNGPFWLTYIGTSRIASGASSCSDANRSSCAVTGCSWSWTCSPAELSVLVLSVHISMAYACVA